MSNVATYVDAVISSDGSRSGGERVCSTCIDLKPNPGQPLEKDGDKDRQGRRLTQHGTALLYDILALEDDGNNRSGSHVFDETWEERLGGEIGIVLLEVLLGSVNHLEGDNLVASLLESLMAIVR